MAKYRILVIDDTRVIRLSLKSLLEKIDAEVFELGNAEDLFQSSWRFHNLDLIFLDIDLPGMNGMTALVRIKEDPKWTEVPIIMLTSHANPVLVKQAIHAGIVDYVKKPFVGESLLQRVKSLLNMSDDGFAETATQAAPSEKIPELSPVDANYIVQFEIDPVGALPSGLTSFFQPPDAAGIQLSEPLALKIPFRFAGTLEEATAAMKQHLMQNQITVMNFTVTSA
jgi:CheY-like chemotaxis protein